MSRSFQLLSLRLVLTIAANIHSFKKYYLLKAKNQPKFKLFLWFILLCWGMTTPGLAVSFTFGTPPP